MLLIAVITSGLGIGAATGGISPIDRARAANHSADLRPPGGKLKTVVGGVTTIKGFESSVTRSMQKAGVSGLSVAILNDGKVVFRFSDGTTSRHDLVEGSTRRYGPYVGLTYRFP